MFGSGKYVAKVARPGQAGVGVAATAHVISIRILEVVEGLKIMNGFKGKGSISLQGGIGHIDIRHLAPRLRISPTVVDLKVVNALPHLIIGGDGRFPIISNVLF
ncbi:MAG: hypothetical protein WCK08_17335 [Betaproteobacteria bacterium]